MKFLLPFYFFCFFAVFSNLSFAQNPTQFLLLSEKIRNGSDEEKREILFQIRNLKSEQASRLAIPALSDSSEIVRATAVSSVIFLPPNEAAQILIPFLKDKSPFVRRETAYALGKTKNPQTVNYLLNLLQNDKQFEVRNAAAIALGEIGDVSAVENLTKILNKKPKSGEEFLRRSAARSIGQIAENQKLKLKFKVDIKQFYAPDKIIKPENLTEKFPIFLSANNILIAILQNKKESSDTKREAAFALGEIGDAESIRVLRANLSVDDYYLAEIAEKALTNIRQVSNNETKSRN